MPGYTITPNEAGAFDVVVIDDHGDESRAFGLPRLTAALEWMTQQPRIAERAEAPARKR